MHKIRDGDLYTRMNIDGREIEIRYGYYADYERGRQEPIPIYPDFTEEPMYTKDGYPLATAMQDVCDRFEGGDPDMGCFSCKYFLPREDFLGVCTNDERKIKEKIL